MTNTARSATLQIVNEQATSRRRAETIQPAAFLSAPDSTDAAAAAGWLFDPIRLDRRVSQAQELAEQLARGEVAEAIE